MSDSPKANPEIVRIAGKEVRIEYLDDPAVDKQHQKLKAAAEAFQRSLEKKREQNRKNRSRREMVMGRVFFQNYLSKGQLPHAIKLLDAAVDKPSERELFPELRAIDRERQLETGNDLPDHSEPVSLASQEHAGPEAHHEPDSSEVFDISGSGPKPRPRPVGSLPGASVGALGHAHVPVSDRYSGSKGVYATTKQS